MHDKVSEDESDEDFIPDDPMSEIEDNVDTIAKSSMNNEDHNNEEREAVHNYWNSFVKINVQAARLHEALAKNIGSNLQQLQERTTDVFLMSSIFGCP